MSVPVTVIPMSVIGRPVKVSVTVRAAVMVRRMMRVPSNRDPRGRRSSAMLMVAAAAVTSVSATLPASTAGSATTATLRSTAAASRLPATLPVPTAGSASVVALHPAADGTALATTLPTASRAIAATTPGPTASLSTTSTRAPTAIAATALSHRFDGSKNERNG
jgi:hypothetical protein